LYQVLALARLKPRLQLRPQTGKARRLLV